MHLFRPLRPHLAIGLILLCSAAWSSWFIARTSFLIDGVRHFCLFDDAMISMTYAKNLLAGHGLNWARAGEPVEGYTHPLWLLAMVGVHLLPLAPHLTSLAMQVVSWVSVGAALVLVWQLARRHFGAPASALAAPAAILTGCYYPLNFWSLVGMESALQLALLAAAALLALDIVHAGRRSHLALGAVASASLLLRMDMVVPLAAIGAYVAWQRGFRSEGRRWLFALAIVVVPQLAYGAFRALYFHDLLPNTYFLKMTGVDPAIRILRGAIVFTNFVRPVLPLVAALVLAAVPLVPSQPKLLLPLLLVAAGWGYSIYVGGDAWDWAGMESRFLVPVVPFLFVLLNGLLNLALDRFAPALERYRLSSLALGWGVGGLVLVFALAFNGLIGQEKSTADQRWRRVLIADEILHVGDHRQIIGDCYRLKKLLPPEASVAVNWAGIPAYFTDFRMVDQFGYNDRTIAREPARKQLSLARAEDYVPGHVKWNFPYVLNVKRPDAFLQYVTLEPHAETQLRNSGYQARSGFWVRTDSPRVGRDGAGREAGGPGGVVAAGH